MLNLGRLRLLRELHQRETIAAVADALQFTPSAVSQQLAMLEREAGVRLLERAGRRVRLTDPALAAKLLTSGRGYDSSAAAGSLLHPQVWEHVSDYAGLVHGLDAPLFLHSRNRPDGVERLVAVRPVPTARYAFTSPTQSGPKWELKSQPLTFLANTGGSTQPLSCVGSTGVPLVYTSDDRVTIFAGQADASNASHFTIGYSINGHHGTLEGWLQNDDSIRLAARDGPLKR